MTYFCLFFFFSSRRRHTSSLRDWSSDVCSSDLAELIQKIKRHRPLLHVKGFTAVELDYMFRKAKLSVEDGLKLLHNSGRSEERRVGKECRCRWWPYN